MKPYEITYEEFLDAHKMHRGIKPYLRASALFLAIIYAVGGKDLFSAGGLSPLAIELLSCGAIGIIVSPLLFRHKLRKTFESSKIFREAVRMEFNSETYHTESKSGTCNREWKNIHKVKHGRNLIILYETKQLMRIIPDRAFSDTNERDEFLKVATLHANQGMDPTR